MDVVFFPSAAALREWLEANHDKAQELWIGFYKKSAGETGLTYPEAVDEALCYGWIDGIRKKLDDTRYVNRFTPRKRSSNWSAVNIKRVGELIEMGRMQPPGLKAFQERDERRSQQYSFENEQQTLPAEYETTFKTNESAWEFFQSQAPYYKRTAIWWVVSAKQEATRQKRLALLIEHSAKGERLPMFARPKKS